MKAAVLFYFVFSTFFFFSQTNGSYDAELANKLGADEYGMKKYVFCILKTGKNSSATPEEKQKLFEGHMNNINKLAKEKKLVLAGPFMKNDKDYRGLFILNCETIDEAIKLVETDPAVHAKLLEAELIPWYGTAALGVTIETHEKILKKKP